MTEDQNKSVALIIPLIVTNNAGKVAIALRDAGYAKKFIPPGELEAGLFQLYTANPDKFFEVMKTIPWNYGEKTTNKPEIKDELIKLVVSNSRNADYEVDKETWWKELIALLSPGVPALEEQRTESKKKNYGLIFLLATAAIALVIGFILLIRSL